MMESVYDKLAGTISERCFNGLLPPNPCVLVQAVISMPEFQDATEEQLQFVADRLIEAFHKRIEQDFYRLSIQANGGKEGLPS